MGHGQCSMARPYASLDGEDGVERFSAARSHPMTRSSFPYDVTKLVLSWRLVNSRRPALGRAALNDALETTRGLFAMACTACPWSRLVVAGPSSCITTSPALEATPPPILSIDGSPPRLGSAVP